MAGEVCNCFSLFLLGLSFCLLPEWRFLLNDSQSFTFTPSFLTQRVNQCLRDACHNTGTPSCMRFIDCGHGNDFSSFYSDPNWTSWKNNENASACLTKDGNFSYGIYGEAVNLTAEQSIITRYAYSLFWGFQVFLLSISSFLLYLYIWNMLYLLIQVEICFV